jgi:hypothetical protein
MEKWFYHSLYILPLNFSQAVGVRHKVEDCQGLRSRQGRWLLGRAQLGTHQGLISSASSRTTSLLQVVDARPHHRKDLTNAP